MAYRSIRLLTSIGALALVTACATSRQTDFYLLKATLPDRSDAVLMQPDSTLCIKTIHLPEYLDRPQMVVRDPGYRLQLSEFHRWAEPLRDNFARVLTENLEARLIQKGIGVRGGGCRGMADYQLGLEIVSFETESKGNAILKVPGICWGVTI